MASKEVILPDIGTIRLYKRKGTRHIRLSVGTNGIRVTMPPWIPYSAGITFAKQKSAWLQKHAQPRYLLEPDFLIGHNHRLIFINNASRLYSRVKDNQIKIFLPPDALYDHPEVQQAARQASIRALRNEAEAVLPGRLRSLANQHDFSFKSVTVKRLRSRWGSCNHQKEIVLNCFLMQLPWHLIDYVLLHELAHTKVLAHGTPFWSLMAEHVSNLPAIRKEIREYRPIITHQSPNNLGNHIPLM